ncbi:MAG: hypothetical protein HY457_01525 [Parcubacteria group bacterium]|nr:hypothetical protein [Parcubacteria group bacterium]
MGTASGPSARMWRTALEFHAREERRKDLERKRGSEREEARKIIDQIPILVAWAMNRNESSVKLFGWMSDDDVAGDHPDRVDNLWEALQRENRTLEVGDLAGRALIVFAQCDTQDFECFLSSEKVHMGGIQYHFCIRPKQAK